MTIKEQADQIVERYRPYAEVFEFDEYHGWKRDELESTERATLCAIKEVEARIEEAYWLGRKRELTAILNELKSRV